MVADRKDRGRQGDRSRHGEAGNEAAEHSGAHLGDRRKGPGMNLRARRGEIRAAILALLQEQPMHGYQILQELSERTRGAWNPSPGSVYPKLGVLEDEGLVSSREAEGKRVFELTEAGRAQAAKQPPGFPWNEFTGPHGDRMGPLRDALVALTAATKQVAHTGTPEMSAEALEILVDARKRMYRMLSEADT